MSDKISKYRYDGSKKFEIDKFDRADKGGFDNRVEALDEFVENLQEINSLQQKLYADGREGIIFVFQAMDAAGKDGVIRTVFSTLSPHGVKEFCFKVPSVVEKSHDYLWRFWDALPPKGSISIFNRSYYEDVLAGRVKELYLTEKKPDRMKDRDIIEDRYDQINEFEKYLYHTATRVVKIFLNVSKDEQARRFISRMDVPKKNWKLSMSDIEDRKNWDKYMEAFEVMINKTSSKHSPWYVVPADHKWFARLLVSRIVLESLKEMNPVIAEEELGKIKAYREELLASITSEKPEEDKGNSEFEDPSTVTAGIIAKEELDKINEKNDKLRDNGFGAVRALLAMNYILKSPEAIVDAVVDRTEDEITDEMLAAAKIENAGDSAYDEALAAAEQRLGGSDAPALSKEERKILKMLREEEESDVYDVYVLLDLKPSKADEILIGLEEKGLLTVEEPSGTVRATEQGLACDLSKIGSKKRENLDRFLRCLNTAELNELMALVDSFRKPGAPFSEEDDD